MRTPATSRSAELFAAAQEIIPGGVNSPVRAFKGVGGNPLFIKRAQACRLQDADGRQYLDYVGSWGPMILGHAHPEVVEAIQEAARRGTSYGAPTEAEILLAEKIHRFFPSVEKVRLVSSGTEATMSALRLARAYTGRSKILKFEGCYHGHSDSLLAKSGSGVATLGLPDSPGIPQELAAHTITIPFNDLQALEEAFARWPNELAAVIVEPVPANMGVVPPQEGFLDTVLAIAGRYDTLAIFDEVITGFRLALGGAQEYFSLSAPLTCLGKILGGGLPIAAYGGRRQIMDLVAPQGPVYQAGTLSGNPIAVAAGLKTLEILEREKPYAALEAKTLKLCHHLSAAAERHGVNLQVQRCSSMFTPFFTAGPVTDFSTAKQSDLELFRAFFHAMLDAGVYLAPSQFEACFLSTAHTDADVEETVRIAEAALQAVPARIRR